MKFTVKPPPVPAEISIRVRDCGGYEGVQLEIFAEAGYKGIFEGLMAVDPTGKVWTGDSYSILVGHFESAGKFVWALK
jgi:hypothetical protein